MKPDYSDNDAAAHVAERLGMMGGEPRPAMSTPILDRAVELTGLTITEITSARQSKANVWARWGIALALSRRDKGTSVIGRLLNRDHSTVTNGLRRAIQHEAVDEVFAAYVQALLAPGRDPEPSFDADAARVRATGIRLLTTAADNYDAFCAARAAMNAATPAIEATRAERALYDERYKADSEAEREHWHSALALAKSARAILAELRAAPAYEKPETDDTKGE